jgi:hypothetical protein
LVTIVKLTKPRKKEKKEKERKRERKEKKLENQRNQEREMVNDQTVNKTAKPLKKGEKKITSSGTVELQS